MSFFCGAPIRFIFIFAFCSIRSNKHSVYRVYNVMQVPLLPARAVLPARWIYESISFGGSLWITKSTEGISKPLEATSVATRHLTFPLRKAVKVASLWVWFISPWIIWTSSFTLSLIIKSLHSFFVLTKTKVDLFFPP